MDSILKTLVSSTPDVQADDIPPSTHQEAVNDLAEEYLSYLTDGSTTGARLLEIAALFREHPLLGLEVTDEALVLYKNRNDLWGKMSAQFQDPIVARLMADYDSCYAAVCGLRNGRERHTTTPTLRGGDGGRRPSTNAGPQASCR